MKRISLISAALLTLPSLIQCTTAGNGAASRPEVCYDSLGPIVASYLPAREADSIDRWGLVRHDGTMLFSDRFDSRPSAAVNGYFSVSVPDGISVWHASAEPSPVEGLSGLRQAGAMSGGLMPVCRKGRRIEIVDGEGTVRMELTSIDGREIVTAAPYFIDGLLNVLTQDGLWGTLNTTGEMVLEPVYSYEPNFNERISPLTRQIETMADSNTVRTELRHYLVNSSGRIIFTFPKGYEPEGTVRGGRIAIRDPQGRIAMLDTDGNITQLPDAAVKAAEYDRDYTVWTDSEGLYGLCDARGNVLISPQFRTLALAPGNRMLAEAGNDAFMLTDSVGAARLRFNGFERVTCIDRPAPGIVSPFGFIGDGFAGKMLLDAAGHRQGPGTFRDIDTRVTLLDDGYVHTDFFNSQAAVHAIISRLTDRGWGRASVGEMMAPLAEALDEKTASATSLKIESDTLYMLNLAATAYSDRPVALDSIASGERIFRPNPESVVSYIKVEAAAPTACFPVMVQHLGSELVPRGYRAEKIRDGYAVYRSPAAMVIITPRKGLKGLNLFIMDRSFYESAGQDIISDGEKTYLRHIQS